MTDVENGGFCSCTLLTGVVIPDSVRQLENGAFQGCSALTSVTIPDSVTRNGRYAFTFCSQLTLTAPARLLRRDAGRGIKMVAKECGCGESDYRRFRDGWVCAKHAGRKSPRL